MIRIYALVFHPNVEFCLCLCTPLICRQINQKIKLAYSSINQTIGEVYLAVSGHCLFYVFRFRGTVANLASILVVSGIGRGPAPYEVSKP